MIRAKLIAPLLALGLATAACTTDEGGTGPSRIKPNVATVRLSISGKTINITNPGNVATGGPISLALNATSQLTGQFLRTNGAPDPLVVAPDFEMRVQPSSSNVIFTRTGSFSGTVRGTVIGNYNLSIRLRSLEANVDDVTVSIPISITSLEQ